ncbi:MAG: N-acetylmuramoyl-L-alanine amidase [Clostridia bacterium]|nr:N-acetylmuramoyl-L-alanine amidase [Clostridia bacterium]
MAKKVFIGVGHGGSDPGAVAGGLKEKEVNLAVALACKAELERHGVAVRMSRTKDETDSLEQRIKECNAYAPDLALDIHHNAGGGDGAEVFYHYKGGVSKVLAQNVLDAIVAAGQNSRGIKVKLNAQGRDYFGFIRQTVAPAVIVEGAFLDNKADVQFIDTAAEQTAEGVAIAKGILKTLGVAWVPEVRYTVTVAGLDRSAAEKLAAEMKTKGFSASVKVA